MTVSVMASPGTTASQGEDVGAQDGAGDHRQAERRHGQHRVGSERDEPVDPAAMEAGQRTQAAADQHREAGYECRQRERHASRIEHPREDVASEVVGAEQVLAAGRLLHGAQVHGVGIEGRNRGRRQRCKRQQHEHCQPGGPERLA